MGVLEGICVREIAQPFPAWFTGTPFDHWNGGLPYREITQIRGPVGSGKTTLLVQFLNGFGTYKSSGDGKIVYITSDVVTKRISSPFHVGCYCTDNLSHVRFVLEDARPSPHDLVVIDDVGDYFYSGPEGSAASEWNHIAEILTRSECTTVVAETHRKVATHQIAGRSLSRNVLDYITSLCFDLSLIATTIYGPVVEALVVKSKISTEASPLRLWIRPEHKTPVMIT